MARDTVIPSILFHRSLSDQPIHQVAGAYKLKYGTCFGLASKSGAFCLQTDLQEGIAKFLLKLSPAFTAVDALEKVTELDDTLWSEAVAKADLIDVLISGPVAGQMQYSVGRLRRFLDLPGRLDDLALEALEEYTRILMVCTPDLPTLFLAREKIRYLESRGIKERIGLLLNRWKSTPR